MVVVDSFAAGVVLHELRFDWLRGVRLAVLRLDLVDPGLRPVQNGRF